jgi:hypothetical protein
VFQAARSGIEAALPKHLSSWIKFLPGKVTEPDMHKKTDMLYTIAIVLILLWLLGLVSSYTINGFIHGLLVIAVILILVRIINGKKPV